MPAHRVLNGADTVKLNWRAPWWWNRRVQIVAVWTANIAGVLAVMAAVARFLPEDIA